MSLRLFGGRSIFFTEISTCSRVYESDRESEVPYWYVYVNIYVHLDVHNIIIYIVLYVSIVVLLY